MKKQNKDNQMNDAKIRLSKKETELITNPDWILTKNLILKKIDCFFSSLQVKQKEILNNHKLAVSDEIKYSSPKISKGENYNGLPYRMLDFPKAFNQSEIFAIRTMFWWGHFFSTTIHLSGNVKPLFEKNIIEGFTKLKGKEIYCCVNENQWEHHFEITNYIPIDSLNKKQFASIISNKSFCKLAIKDSIQQLEVVEVNLLSSFHLLIKLLED